LRGNQVTTRDTTYICTYFHTNSSTRPSPETEIPTAQERADHEADGSEGANGGGAGSNNAEFLAEDHTVRTPPLPRRPSLMTTLQMFIYDDDMMCNVCKTIAHACKPFTFLLMFSRIITPFCRCLRFFTEYDDALASAALPRTRFPVLEAIINDAVEGR
jgi:hypothetical protein